MSPREIEGLNGRRSSHNQSSLTTFTQGVSTTDDGILPGGVDETSLVKSANMRATVSAIGAIELYVELTVLLAAIAKMGANMKAFASGEVFQSLIDEFYTGTGSIFENTELFGDVARSNQKATIQKLAYDLRRVSVGSDLIEQALVKINTLENRINSILKNTQSDYINSGVRQEDMLVWASRKGAVLNKMLFSKMKLGINVSKTVQQPDLYGLYILLNDIRRSLETLQHLPAYYKTGDTIQTDRMTVPVREIIVGEHETIQLIAERELGDPNKDTLILEFNNLSYADTISSSWVGTAVKIPFASGVSAALVSQNNVLAAQDGIEILGKDIKRTMVVTDTGDLDLNDYADNFIQSLESVMEVHVGGIPENPSYGNRITGVVSEMLPQLQGSAVAVEVARAFMTNPRVERVDNIIVRKENDAVYIKCQVIAVNNILETTLETSLNI